MNVLVTGGCGFAGSNTCEFFRDRGDNVIAFDNLTKHELQRTGYKVVGARSHIRDFLDGLSVKTIEGDVRNLNEVLGAAKECDFIIHTAAQPAMTISVESPDLDFSTNVLGAFNVLEAARKYDLPVVICSTIHVYGNSLNGNLEELPSRYSSRPPEIPESQPLSGTITPLHASKRSAELYGQSYIDTYGVNVGIFRLTGLYGPRQFGGEDHGWVANFAIRTILGQPITVYGTGKQVRDILFVSDLVTAFEKFYSARSPGIYNIGGGITNSISLLECLDMIKEITGKQPLVKHGPERVGDLRYFVCDTTKARQDLHWAPTVRPREGLKMLIQWVNDNRGLFRS